MKRGIKKWNWSNGFEVAASFTLNSPNAEPGDAEDSNLKEDSDEDGNDKPEGEEPDADDEEQELEEGDDLPRHIDIPKKRAGKGSGPKNTKKFFTSISYFSWAESVI